MGIQEYLHKIKTAVYGKDMRQAIHDAIHQCYEDGKSGELDLVAREGVEQIKASIANPSLLINGDFRNPVNQRGLTKYEGSDEKDVYTIDRWKLEKSSSARSVEVLDGCVKITNNNSSYNVKFLQVFEHTLPLDDYTLTVKVKSVSGTATARVGEKYIELVAGINHVSTTEALENVYIGVYTNSSIEIEYIKLERGAIATPFAPRLYSEELLLCRRFYRENAVRLTSWQHTTSYAYFAYNYEPMRVAPVFSYAGFGEVLNHAGAVATVTAVQVLEKTEINRLTIRAVYNDSTTAYYRLISGKIILDAEIY